MPLRKITDLSVSAAGEDQDSCSETVLGIRILEMGPHFLHGARRLCVRDGTEGGAQRGGAGGWGPEESGPEESRGFARRRCSSHAPRQTLCPVPPSPGENRGGVFSAVFPKRLFTGLTGFSPGRGSWRSAGFCHVANIGQLRLMRWRPAADRD